MWCNPGALAISVTRWLASLVSAASFAGGLDSTQEYLDAYRSGCAFAMTHVEVLRRHKVLLVPGYFSDLDSRYFLDQSNWLTSIGVEHEKAAVRSRQSVAINAPIIATAIQGSPKPVILITHSKGSVDALEALRAQPSLRTKVKGWLSLQGAFFGSPVADMLLDGARLNPWLATVILGYFGGTMESAQRLTTGASLAYYRDNKTAIDQVVRQVPAIAFASAFDGASDGRPSTTLEIPLELMKRNGIRSDGLIPTDAAVLPGMAFVKISGVDHIAPVMPAAQDFDRVRMTTALLLVLQLFRDLPADVSCKGRR